MPPKRAAQSPNAGSSRQGSRNTTPNKRPPSPANPSKGPQRETPPPPAGAKPDPPSKNTVSASLLQPVVRFYSESLKDEKEGILNGAVAALGMPTTILTGFKPNPTVESHFSSALTNYFGSALKDLKNADEKKRKDILLVLRLACLVYAAVPCSRVSPILGGAGKLTTLGLVSLVTNSATPIVASIGESGIWHADVRIAALYLISAIASHTPDLQFLQWEQLFPDIAIVPKNTGASHPILGPFLYDTVRGRSAAASATCQLIQKASSQMKMATESKGSKSFATLSTRAYRVLLSVYEAVYHGYKGISDTIQDKTVDGDDLEVRSIRSLYASVYTYTVAHVPIPRCPSILQAIEQTLALPYGPVDMTSHNDRTEGLAICNIIGALARAEGATDMLKAFFAKPEGQRVMDSASRLVLQYEALKALVGIAKVGPIAGEVYKRWNIIGAKLETLFDHMTDDLFELGRQKAALELIMSLACEVDAVKTLPEMPTILALDGSDPEPRHDPALSLTIVQYQQCYDKMVLPVFECAHEDTRVMAYRSLYRFREGFFNGISEQKRKALVDKCLAGLKDPSVSCRSEAYVTIGVWGMKKAFAAHWTKFAEIVSQSMGTELDLNCRGKAGFAMAAMSNYLRHQAGTTVAQPPAETDRNYPLSHRLLLVQTALACIRSGDPVMCCHAYRALGNLSFTFTDDELIVEMPDNPEGLANSIFETLTHAADKGEEPRMRWNALCALSDCLTREQMFFADPPAAREAIEMMFRLLTTDGSFKLQCRCAQALARLPLSVLKPYTTRAFEDCIHSLRGCSATSASFKQFKERDVLQARIKETLDELLKKMTPDEVAEVTSRFNEYAGNEPNIGGGGKYTAPFGTAGGQGSSSGGLIDRSVGVSGEGVTTGGEDRTPTPSDSEPAVATKSS